MRMRDPGAGYRLRPRGAFAENLWSGASEGRRRFSRIALSPRKSPEIPSISIRSRTIDVMENPEICGCAVGIALGPVMRSAHTPVPEPKGISFHEDLKDVDSRPHHRKPRQWARPPSRGL